MPTKTRAILRLRDQVCHYCNAAPGFTFDHIVPDVYGGVFMLWNLQPACASCNHEKAANWPTCPCEKCQGAIIRHMGDPVLSAKARARLDEIERSHLKRVREIENRVQIAKDKLAEFREDKARIIALGLTDHTFDSKVEV